MMRLVFVLILAAAAAPVWGSDARIQSLGVQFEYLEDYILFRQFPTVISRYSNLITASPGGRNLGDHSVGMILSPRSTLDQPFGTWALFLNKDGRDDRNGNLEVAWAKPFKRFTLGGGFMWFGSEEKYDNTVISPVDYPENQEQTSLVIGGLFDVGDRTAVEAAGELAWLRWERKNVPLLKDAESAGKASYRLSVRMVRDLTPETELVPLLHYVHKDVTEKEAIGDSFTNTGSLGLVFRHRVQGKDLLMGGVAFNYFKNQRQTENETATLERWDVPALFLSMEVELASWLTARAGATKTLDVIQDESSVGPTGERIESRYFYGMGVGILIRDLIVDAQLNPDALYTGGYFLSGEHTQLFSRITLTYPF